MTPTLSIIVLAVLKAVGDRGVIILGAIDWEPLQEILVDLGKRRGRPFEHERIVILKAFIYAYANGKTSVLQVWKASTRPLIWNVLGFTEKPCYDTFRRFLEQAEPFMEGLFQEMVKQCKENNIISGRVVAMDTTDLPTLFQSDLDARWNYNATKDEYYYGYALHVVFDAITQLPIAVDFLRGKKIDCRKAVKLWEAIPFRPDIFLADSEYDILKFQRLILDGLVLPVMEYNPRNTSERLPITYRAELYSYHSFEWLNTTYRWRAEAEHGFNILKEVLGLTEFRVRGYRRVKTHSFLHCMLRLGYALAVDKQNKPVTHTITVL